MVCIKDIVETFFDNNKDPDCKNIVRGMVKSFQAFVCLVSLKVHFLLPHLDYFSVNLGAVSKEQGERFRQDVKNVERRFQGNRSITMMGDYC